MLRRALWMLYQNLLGALRIVSGISPVGLWLSGSLLTSNSVPFSSVTVYNLKSYHFKTSHIHVIIRFSSLGRFQENVAHSPR